MEGTDSSAVPDDASLVIRQLRQELGLTQKQFAQLLHVSFSTVNRWENGQAHPSVLAWMSIQLMQHEGPEAYRRRAGFWSSDHDEDGGASKLSPDMLIPGVLPGLWKTQEITVRSLFQYFAGTYAASFDEAGKPFIIPEVKRGTIEDAVRGAVRNRQLWYTWGTASFCGDDIAPNLFVEDARLQEPPTTISAEDILPLRLPQAWTMDTTTALAISVALSETARKSLPWPVVRSAIGAALLTEVLELSPDSGLWPCTFERAGAVSLRMSSSE